MDEFRRSRLEGRVAIVAGHVLDVDIGEPVYQRLGQARRDGLARYVPVVGGVEDAAQARLGGATLEILDGLDEADVLVLDGEGAWIRLLEIRHQPACLVRVPHIRARLGEEREDAHAVGAEADAQLGQAVAQREVQLAVDGELRHVRIVERRAGATRQVGLVERGEHG